MKLQCSTIVYCKGQCCMCKEMPLWFVSHSHIVQFGWHIPIGRWWFLSNDAFHAMLGIFLFYFKIEMKILFRLIRHLEIWNLENKSNVADWESWEGGVGKVVLGWCWDGWMGCCCCLGLFTWQHSHWSDMNDSLGKKSLIDSGTTWLELKHFKASTGVVWKSVTKNTLATIKFVAELIRIFFSMFFFRFLSTKYL